MATSSWEGFSEEDLRQIRDGNNFGADAEEQKKAGSRPKNLEKRPSGTKKSSRSVPKKVILKETGESQLQPDQMLSPPKRISTNEASEARQVKLHTLEQSEKLCDVGQLSAPNGLIKLRVKKDGHSIEVVGESSILRSPDVSHAQNGPTFSAKDDFFGCPDLTNGCAAPVGKSKKVSLEEFQMRQKMIEEQNRKRRLMLTRAIADRKQKTLAETEKLTHIQRELQRLDSLVSSDVAILRDHIEVASMEFNEVQKRYEKAEREFVDAKIELFQKMERKEQLTEHLCTIIEQNEMRKAQKLADLMHELELDAVIENVKDEDPILPQLYALNDIAYTYCTTVRDPKFHSLSPVDEKRQLGVAGIGGDDSLVEGSLAPSFPYKEVESSDNNETQLENGCNSMPPKPDSPCCAPGNNVQPENVGQGLQKTGGDDLTTAQKSTQSS